MYLSKQIKAKTLRKTSPILMQSNMMARIHEVRKAELVDELRRNGNLGHAGRLITTGEPRLKIKA